MELGDRERQRSCICWLAFQIPTIGGWGEAEVRSLELFGTHPWTAETQVPEPSLPASSRHISRKWDWKQPAPVWKVGIPSGDLMALLCTYPGDTHSLKLENDCVCFIYPQSSTFVLRSPRHTEKYPLVVSEGSQRNTSMCLLFRLSTMFILLSMQAGSGSSGCLPVFLWETWMNSYPASSWGVSQVIRNLSMSLGFFLCLYTCQSRSGKKMSRK